MKEETEELAEKLKHKAALHAKLVDEFEKNNRNINRFEPILTPHSDYQISKKFSTQNNNLNF